MALPIISAEQRLAEKRGVKLALLGKAGIGKTTQLKTLPETSTLFVDCESGEAAGEIGFDKPLGHYSEAEALAVVNAIVTTYQEVMSKAQVRANASAQESGPFADLQDDVPWETTDVPPAAKTSRRT
jgi:ABC-type transport system involved in cytochrome bd biosynthesis fused ATPase/permease subunit